MATILVTGGAGYIGSHACKALARAGHVPVTVDSLVTGHRAAIRFGPFVQADLTDRAALDAAFGLGIDAVMHFAALSDVGQSVREPGRYWRNNVLGSLTLIEAMLAHGVTDIVFSSTCATYGEQDGVTLDEGCAQAPINAYGASKRAVEEMLRDFAPLGLRHVAFRYFNVAGADPEAEIGEDHRPETHLVPIALQAALGQRDLTIFGTDYATPDGTCIRDYVHVVDLVAAHLAGLDWLMAGRESRVFNLGTGRGYSVREVVDVVRNITGRNDLPVTEGARRPGDCTALVSGSTRATAELGWRPERSLHDMVADAWRWAQTGGHR